MDRQALARLSKRLGSGTGQAECAAMLGVVVRTVGRVVARMRGGEN